MELQWHIIEINGNNFNNRYSISNLGQIYNNKLNKEMCYYIMNGTKMVQISYETKRFFINVKREVAKHFLPNPNNYRYVLQKDGDYNNCEVSNLIWSPSPLYTPKELVNKKRKFSSKTIKEKRNQIKEQLVKYKGGKCQICGYDKCINALEFHHISPQNKSFNISNQYYRSWSVLKKEVDKCILVCANCHKNFGNIKSNSYNSKEQIIHNKNLQLIEEKWEILQINNNNFNNRYKISNFGKVLDTILGKEKKIATSSNNTKIIRIEYNKQRYSLSLNIAVAKHFLPNPNNYKYVCFLDGNKNNCSVSNLIWSNSSKQITTKTKEELLKEKNKRNVIIKRKKSKTKIITYLNNKCQICGYDKSPKALECHHVNPNEKEHQLSELYTKPWEVIQEELNKCVLVCSNCHREIHAGITPCPELIHKK